MLRHVVMWKIASGAIAPGKTPEDVAESLAVKLRELKDTVPGIIALHAGPDCMGLKGNWDLGLVVDVEDEEALKAYAVHPAHLEVVQQIRQVVSERAAVDFYM